MVRAGIFIGVDPAEDLQKLSDAANRREEDARVGAGARPGRQDSRADAGWPTQKWSEFAVLHFACHGRAHARWANCCLVGLPSDAIQPTGRTQSLSG